MGSHHIGIGLSGGVDSTVAAALLLEQGHRVSGFFMLLPLPGLDDHLGRARQAADQLGIPLHLVDLRRQFKGLVIRYFVHSYRAGLTPNPCILCNREIKFGLLFDAMEREGMDSMATGHYARIRQQGDRPFLFRGLDRAKDQSYFLCRLPPARLARIRLPLGVWRKEAVRARAAALGFRQSGDSESQDVCFLAGTSLAGFLASQGLTGRAGEIVDREGTVLGSHRGIWHYTIGQRRGLGIPDATPWYVCALDPVHNRIVVGKQDGLLSSRVQVRDMQWSVSPPPEEWQGLVQIRSRHRAVPGSVVRAKDGRWIITFRKPQRAVTPGQFCVLYEDDMVAGSAVIEAGQA